MPLRHNEVSLSILLTIFRKNIFLPFFVKCKRFNSEAVIMFIVVINMLNCLLSCLSERIQEVDLTAETAAYNQHPP